nr:AAA family ATPase [Halorhodospira abdelmalekii]
MSPLPLSVSSNHIGLGPDIQLCLDTDPLDYLHFAPNGNLDPAGNSIDSEQARITLETCSKTFLDGIELAPDSTIQQWIETQRIHYRVRAIEWAITLADDLGLRRTHPEAIAIARYAPALDYWHEGGQRCLLRRLLAAGEYTEAIETYQALRYNLREQKQREPEPATTTLVSHLLHRNGSHDSTTGTYITECRHVTALHAQVLPHNDPEILHERYRTLCNRAELIAAHYHAFASPEHEPYGITLWFGYPTAEEQTLMMALRAARKLSTESDVHIGIECGMVQVCPLDSCTLFGTPALIARNLAGFAAFTRTAPGPFYARSAVLLGSESGQQLAELPHAPSQLIPLALQISPTSHPQCSALQPPYSYWLDTTAGWPEGGYRPTLYPIVGRERECAELAAYWRRIREDTTRDTANDTENAPPENGLTGVIVTGEAGIGKSRLVAWLREEVLAAGGCWRELNCEPPERNIAFHPLSSLLVKTASVSSEQSWATAKKGLRNWLGRLETDDPLAIELIAELADITPPPEAGVHKLSATERCERIKKIFVQLAGALAQRRPTVIVLEDTQWADASTLALFEKILARDAMNSRSRRDLSSRPEDPDQPPKTSAESEDNRLLVLLTARHIDAVPRPLRKLPILQLGPLNNTEGTQLATVIAEQLSEAPPLPESEDKTENKNEKKLHRDVQSPAHRASPLAPKLIARCSGVPLFIEQLTKGQQRHGQCVQSGHDYDKGSNLTCLLYDLLGASLHQHGIARRTAQLAAVLDERFTQRDLMIVVAADPLRQSNAYQIYTDCSNIIKTIKNSQNIGKAVLRGDIPAGLRAEVQNRLTELLAAEVVIQCPDQEDQKDLHYTFRHPLIRQVASLFIPAELRTHLRRALTAERLTDSSPESQDRDHRG